MLTVPGVYREATVMLPRASPRTGVPAFVGYAAARAPLPAAPPAALAADGLVALPFEIESWTQFGERLHPPPGYLGEAVRSFFANGGEACVVAALRPGAGVEAATAAALKALEAVDAVDLICVPDLVWREREPGADPAGADDSVSRDDEKRMLALQAAVVEHCERCNDRFALLDSLPGLAVGDPRAGGVLRQRAARSSDMAALYYPWVRSGEPGTGVMPPCGHVAGQIARVDRQVGVHRAPANLPLDAVIAVATRVTAGELALLHDAGVNVLRPVPGRGIRIWGARTLSADRQWRFLSVRRLVIALARWAREALADFAFEPNDPALRRALRLVVEARLEELFRAGALAGETAAEAFYVTCDDLTTSAAERDLGRVVLEVGLAPAAPNEFVVVHIVRDASGVSAATA